MTMTAEQIDEFWDFTKPGLQNSSARRKCSSVQAEIDGDLDAEAVFSLVSEGQCVVGGEETFRTVEVRVR